jgi:hypothetical protein
MLLRMGYRRVGRRELLGLGIGAIVAALGLPAAARPPRARVILLTGVVIDVEAPEFEVRVTSRRWRGEEIVFGVHDRTEYFLPGHRAGFDDLEEGARVQILATLYRDDPDPVADRILIHPPR